MSLHELSPLLYQSLKPQILPPGNVLRKNSVGSPGSGQSPSLLLLKSVLFVWKSVNEQDFWNSSSLCSQDYAHILLFMDTKVKNHDYSHHKSCLCSSHFG